MSLDSKNTVGTFYSVWNGGEITFATQCLVNTETHEIFDIEQIQGDTGCLDELDEQYVIFKGEKHIVYEHDEAADGEYWYQ